MINNYFQNKKKMMTGSVEEVSGYPLTLLKSKGKNLKDYKIYGNSVQEGENVFNKSTVTNGYRVKNTDGTTTAQTGVSLVDYTEVVEGATYIIKGYTSTNTGTYHIAFYDENKVFVSGAYSPSTFTVPTGAKYVRKAFANEDLDNIVIYREVSPDNPIEIESVGDKTNNLFDARTLEQGTIPDATGKLSDSTTRVRTKPISLEANTYTLRVDYVSNAPFIRGVHIYNYETENWEEYKAFNSRTATFTLTKLSKVRFVFNNSTNAVITPEDIIKLNPILQLGESIVGDYEPYGYRIPIKSFNGNIIKDRMKQILTSGGTGGVVEEGTDWAICAMLNNDQATNVQPGSTNYSSGWVRIGYNYSDVGKWYKVSYDIEYLEVVKGEFNFPINHRVSNGGMTTVNTRIDGLGKKYHVESVWQSNGDPANLTLNSCKVKITNFRLYESENEITTNSANIYLNEPLRKIGDYKDYIDFKNQKVVRNIYHVHLDGSSDEVIKLQAINTYGIANFWITNIPNHLQQKNLISNRLVRQNSVIANTTTEGCMLTLSDKQYIYMRLKSERVSTVDEFKEWLKTNNIDIAYVIATPTEETIELPNIPTHKGTTIVETETKISPSDMWAKYVKK